MSFAYDKIYEKCYGVLWCFVHKAFLFKFLSFHLKFMANSTSNTNINHFQNVSVLSFWISLLKFTKKNVTVFSKQILFHKFLCLNLKSMVSFICNKLRKCFHKHKMQIFKKLHLENYHKNLQKILWRSVENALFFFLIF